MKDIFGSLYKRAWNTALFMALLLVACGSDSLTEDGGLPPEGNPIRVTGVSFPSELNVVLEDFIIQGKGFQENDRLRLTLTSDNQVSYLCNLTLDGDAVNVHLPEDICLGVFRMTLVRNESTLGIGNITFISSLDPPPGPAGESPSLLYALTVDGNPVPVYNAKVASADDNSRWAAMGDIINSYMYFAMAAFATFDMEQPATVTVTLPRQVHSVKVLPASAGIVPAIAGNTFSFQLATPRKLTFEVNGEWVNALHVFANPPETDVPDINDPKVIYFGPGIHEFYTLKIYGGQTLYLAEGAILKGKLRDDEPYTIEYHGGAKRYVEHTAIELNGNNIRICGRGIIDMEDCTTHSRRTMEARSCTNLTVEGVIFRNAAEWNLALHDCDGVDVHNIKILGYRANSDGIDICSSRGVTVDDCFIRTLDDLVVVKTEQYYPSQSRNITVRNCILWNEVAHALSLGAEITAGMDNILFTDCDVIHDKGREWTLRVYHCDKAIVSNIRFENIRVEESKKLISLWIGENSWWTSDPERGHISDVTFKDIAAQGAPLTVELKGYDATHKVSNVSLENVRLNGAPLTMQQVSRNAFVEDVVVKN
jgi:hypothetical protein